MIRTRLLAPAALAVFTLCAPAAHAEGWQFLPLLNDPSFKLEPTVALTGARVDPKQGATSNAWGLDLNFNCGLLQSPDKRMRTHINLTSSDEQGVKTTGFELSPRYTVPMAGGFSVGVGPSLALFKVEAAGLSRTLSGLGAALGVNFRAGAYYAGADLRVHATGAKDGVDYDPTTLGFKVGVNF
jgi:hypothetical protein